ncbi:hypothetical protein SLA_0342 [Streptomyces laurentii]|uniref:Uncharacterized protein n=1 Tax=Streptomyces laurentii TaxID=39478 RepID=A0A160NSH7_STRLU|nr:hypothetical protein SLA_0342 [Streptomyces laurentii]
MRSEEHVGWERNFPVRYLLVQGDTGGEEEGALFVGARVVREVLAAVEEFQQAGARRPHPRTRRVPWIVGHGHHAVHEARHVRPETGVR